MGYKKPDRQTVIDRKYPVRLTLLSQPQTYERTRQWLERHVGHANYGVSLAPMWGSNKAVHIHFKDLHAAMTFVLSNPHVRLHGESYGEHGY